MAKDNIRAIPVDVPSPTQVKNDVKRDFKIRHLTQAAAGEMIGFGRQTMSNILSNDEYFTEKQAILFSLAFGYNKEYLMTGKGALKHTEEILCWAREKYASAPESEKANWEYMFPELKESEDERIRKYILKACKETIEAGDSGLELSMDTTKKLYAYLEKQKEQPTNEEMLRTLRVEYEKGVADTIAKYEQKEQKPVTIVRIPKFRVGDIIQHVPLEKWDKSRKITSIDEHGYNFNRSHLGDTISGGAIGFAFEDEYELVEQKPAGWSEEDENCLIDVESAVNHCFDEEYAKELCTWLKPLRLQPHWKPSGRQMAVLSWFCDGIVNEACAPDLRVELKSLYDNLKLL